MIRVSGDQALCKNLEYIKFLDVEFLWHILQGLYFSVHLFFLRSYKNHKLMEN